MVSRLWIIVLFAALGLGCLLGLEWLVRLGRELSDLPYQVHLLQEATSRRQEMDRVSRQLTRIIDLKARITQDLVEGRTTLLRAASQFRHLNEKADLARGRFQSYSGGIAAESLCREVIGWVRLRLQEKPDPSGSDLVWHLEAELTDLLSRSGGLQLPEGADWEFLD